MFPGRLRESCFPSLNLSFPIHEKDLLVFPGGSAGKDSVHSEGDLRPIPGSGGSPGEEKGCPLQCSGLESPMDCVVPGVTKTQTRLSDFGYSLFPAWKCSADGMSILEPRWYCIAREVGFGWGN